MPFETVTVMDQRHDFVALAQQPGSNISQLCLRFGITRRTGYKWLERYRSAGLEGLSDRSRKPYGSPGKTPPEVEAAVIELRKANPAWGAKKLGHVLLRDGQLGHFVVPSRPTITAILHRAGLIAREESERARPLQRFERESPNDLWQMDFKGPIYLVGKKACHPLTITDDHSRYNIGLFACRDQRHLTVKAHLEYVFGRYGIPWAILTDNGPPWGSAGQREDGGPSYTELGKWLIRVGIRLCHGRPYHPQTQGKEERFHRTLKAELLSGAQFEGYEQCQRGFNKWRKKYNHYRPHEAIGMQVPSQRYKPSKRSFPSRLPEPEYSPWDEVRAADSSGQVSFRGRAFRIGKAFGGEYVALRQSMEDGTFDVYFYKQRIKTISLR